MPTQFPPSQQIVLVDSLSDTEQEDLISFLLGSVGDLVPPPHLSPLCTLLSSPPLLARCLASLPGSPVASTATDEFPVVTAPCPHRCASGNCRCLINVSSGSVAPQRRTEVEDLMKVYCRKRKRIGWDSDKEVDEEKIGGALVPLKRIRGSSWSDEVYIRVPDKFLRRLNWRILSSFFFVKAIPRGLTHGIRRIEDVGCVSRVVERGEEEERAVVPVEFAIPLLILENEVVADTDEVDVRSMSPAGENDGFCDGAGDIMCKEEELSVGLRKTKDTEEVLQPLWEILFGADLEMETNKKGIISANCLGKEPHFLGQGSPTKVVVTTNVVKDQLPAKVPSGNGNVNGFDCLREEEPCILRQKSCAETVATANEVKGLLPAKVPSGNAKAPRRRALFQDVERCGPVNTPIGKKKIERQGAKLDIADKLMSKHGKEGDKGAANVSPEEGSTPKDFPLFESFIVEEEEGSGGYGTVYRARRRHDGATVAIKCPHADAHKSNVYNELKMLERFGGRNFIIKYEGRLKSKTSDCFVLEYVEHDRPEILKKEIDVFQLRWYGYCLFKALISLHKQGVVHRDVKPGNFLFSRKANKGYLIDFNLAMDLHQKYGIPNKLKTENQARLKPETPSSSKPLHSSKNKRFLGVKSFDVVKQEVTNCKNVKKKNAERTKDNNMASSWNVMKSQGADGSGITSAKDMTSTRTQSAERRKEPLPCHGRKELISLLQEAMHSPNHQASSGPVSVRKRVAAPHGRVDPSAVYPTPMPLNQNCSTQIGDAKHKKEGPCAGTKGFRAPEVLFRSLHQGTKVDIWSAGVTLLYLITGRAPFYGDPEQNMKDIARLRGSEDLWEVSKLHDRESAFPQELYSRQYLPSISLLEWCKINTKRRDFIGSIPASLIDLVDKCLTVNPRLRISAEDALKHEFFAACHESLRKHRLLRQGRGLDAEAAVPLQEQIISRNSRNSQRPVLTRLDNVVT